MSGLVRAAHGGPALAVVVLSVLLGVAAGLAPERVLLVALAVAAGQLSVGWSNDLVDEARDRAVGRADKPLVAGGVSRRTVLVACALSVVAVVVLSLACGWAAGLVHLACVASAWSYNLGLKATVWSWAPYAFSFGALVVFVSLADSPPQWPPWWLPAVGALLGVGAHLLNVLPDLGDDAATGVRGLPHRLGRRWIPPVAAVVLLTGTAIAAVGAGLGVAAVVGLGLAVVLAVVVLMGRGRLPFLAAVLIALTDVVLLVVVS
jgi:4-hydroxybenzoate polyprenyltransferase